MLHLYLDCSWRLKTVYTVAVYEKQSDRLWEGEESAFAQLEFQKDVSEHKDCV